jgi:hypothetical protein
MKPIDFTAYRTAKITVRTPDSYSNVRSSDISQTSVEGSDGPDLSIVLPELIVILEKLARLAPHDFMQVADVALKELRRLGWTPTLPPGA